MFKPSANNMMVTLGLILGGLWACENERRDECEWFLAPNPAGIGKTDPNMIPVCAKNLVSNACITAPGRYIGS